ncbi:UTP--glucose-1-phosphate uridylyltransferase [Pancytospora philotis]|nr:UTP--glucose-1-phosphate uridylyltransferase [Pancytospora philotis]
MSSQNEKSIRDQCIADMKGELEKLEGDYAKPQELGEFYNLYKRFMETKDNKIDWQGVKPAGEQMAEYSGLSEPSDCGSLLSKLAVLKLNGGLGTTMGCVGPKSKIAVRGSANFIDIVHTQLSQLNKEHGCSIPLVLMNSFNTDDETAELIGKYGNVRTFLQAQYPRISAESYLLPSKPSYYPPGHGDLFRSLSKCGMLEELIREGKEYLFVSNVDNLGATVDPKILSHVAAQRLDFCMEVTEKTLADVKGGTLASIDGRTSLLEIAQVPEEHKGEFTGLRKFKIFNTNSVWIRLAALKKALEGAFELDIIRNEKVVSGERVIQLETAIGSAIKCFERSSGVVVPRTRFLPVKSCADLLLLRSNLYAYERGCFSVSSARIGPQMPVVKLEGKSFARVASFERAFSSIPDLQDLTTLVVCGDVRFGKGIKLSGIVVICAGKDAQLDIPDGAQLEDKVVTGSMQVLSL